MDVISLSVAGFPHAVAPLGTALTEDQLALLWRMADEPILCFDGDKAGRRAAYRALDLALPHLGPASPCASRSCPKARTRTTSRAAAAPAAVERVLSSARARSWTSSGRGRREAAPLDTPSAGLRSSAVCGRRWR